MFQNYNKVNDIAIKCISIKNAISLLFKNKKRLQVVKKRLVIAVRRGAYDPSTTMYEIPICFESEKAAKRAMQNIKDELKGVAGLELAIVNQTMVGIRYDSHDRYDEAGDFPRLYPTRKDVFYGYVVHLDLTDDLKVREMIQQAIEKLKLAIINEGTPEEQVLEFIE